MTPKEIITHQPPFFSTAEDWNAFVELSKSRQGIAHEWLKDATVQLRNHLSKHPQPRWNFTSWGADTDTKLYLEDFGEKSLFIGFGWNYELQLYLGDHNQFDSDEINSLLKTPEFNPILIAFERIDRSFEQATKATNYRNFHFGSPNDGNIPVDELAWYAGNRTDEFVQQAVAQLEAFTKNEEVTDLIYRLNEQTQIK